MGDRTINDSLRELWGNLIFRRVKNVVMRDDQLIGIKYVYVDDEAQINIQRVSSYDDVSDELRHNARSAYKNYFGFTYKKRLSCDSYNKEIFFSKKDYAQIDLHNKVTGKFSSPKNYSKISQIPPDTNALICGLVEDGPRGPHFKRWFICSDQFYNMWLHIMGHKRIASNDLINNLSTGEWLDWYENPEIDIKDKQKSFVINRFEKCARDWRHVYCIIVLLSNNENIPDGLHAPYDFVNRLLRQLLWNHDNFIDNGWEEL